MVYPQVNNKMILSGYLVLFAAVIGAYDLYRENTYAVALAGAVLLITGLLAWLASIRGSQK